MSLDFVVQQQRRNEFRYNFSVQQERKSPLLSFIISGIWTVFLETLFVITLGYFELEKTKLFFNEGITLSIITIILWSILFFIDYLNKGIINKLRPAIRVHILLLPIAHLIVFIYIFIQEYMNFCL